MSDKFPEISNRELKELVVDRINEIHTDLENKLNQLEFKIDKIKEKTDSIPEQEEPVEATF